MPSSIWGAGLTQWWEHSPPTDVARVRFWATHMWAKFVVGFFVSKETVVLRRWGRSKQKFGFINSFDKTKFKFVVGSFSGPRGFSPCTPVFPSPQKPALLNSNSTRNAHALNTWETLNYSMSLIRETGRPLLKLREVLVDKSHRNSRESIPLRSWSTVSIFRHVYLSREDDDDDDVRDIWNTIFVRFYVTLCYLMLLNSQPRIMHFAYSDSFTQSWLSVHIP